MEENGNVNEPVGGESSEPALEVRQPDGTRRPANATEARILRERGGMKVNVPDPADQAALDALRAKDDAQQAKQGEDGGGADEPTELSVPGETPSEHTELVESFVEQIAPIARELNLPVGDVHDVVDLAVSIAVTDRSNVSLEDRDACVVVLNSRYGTDEAKAIIADAQTAVERLGPKMSEFLDSTMLGNDPSVLYALAAYKRGDLKMSPAKAQAELDKLMKGGEDLRSNPYRNADHPKHKSAVARANLLYRAIEKGSKGGAQKESQPAVKSKSASGSRNAQLDAKIKALNNHPAVRDKSHPEYGTVRAQLDAAYNERWPGSE